jgi:hypothetical protein
MSKFRICTIDADENNEVNDEHSTSHVVDLPEEPSRDEVCAALKECGMLSADWPNENVILMDDTDTDFFVCNDEGRKKLRLRLEE